MFNTAYDYDPLEYEELYALVHYQADRTWDAARTGREKALAFGELARLGAEIVRRVVDHHDVWIEPVHSMLERALEPHLADTAKADPVQTAKRKGKAK